MVRIDSLFGNYLKSSDITGEMPVEIVSVAIEHFGREDESEKKAVVYFVGIEKGLVLNRINSDILKELSGTDETDDWNALNCVLYVDPNVQFGGKRVGGVRIKAVEADPVVTKERVKK